MHWRPFQQRQKVVEVEGRFISYLDNGSGSPLILLHGIPTWGYLWHRLVSILEQSRRVLVPDLPGYGYSDRSDRFDRGVARQADFLAGWMQALGLPRADVVGHDIGGAVALRLAAFHPGRVGKLCLMDAVSYDSWPIEPLLQLAHPASHKRLNAQSAMRILRMTLREGFREPDDDLIEGLLSPYATEEGKLSLIRDAISLDTNQTMEIVPLLPRLKTPTLILWGEEDAFQPVHYGRRLAWDMPLSRFAVVPRAGHFLMIDQPAEVSAQLRNFLSLEMN
jgi:pimeloyl-ACP methyl ester carboxylesterase